MSAVARAGKGLGPPVHTQQSLGVSSAIDYRHRVYSGEMRRCCGDVDVYCRASRACFIRTRSQTPAWRLVSICYSSLMHTRPGGARYECWYVPRFKTLDQCSRKVNVLHGVYSQLVHPSRPPATRAAVPSRYIAGNTLKSPPHLLHVGSPDGQESRGCRSQGVFMSFWGGARA